MHTEACLCHRIILLQICEMNTPWEYLPPGLAKYSNKNVSANLLGSWQERQKPLQGGTP